MYKDIPVLVHLHVPMCVCMRARACMCVLKPSSTSSDHIPHLVNGSRCLVQNLLINLIKLVNEQSFNPLKDTVYVCWVSNLRLVSYKYWNLSKEKEKKGSYPKSNCVVSFPICLLWMTYSVLMGMRSIRKNHKSSFGGGSVAARVSVTEDQSASMCFPFPNQFNSKLMDSTFCSFQFWARNA
jgi:hypothetical protein